MMKINRKRSQINHLHFSRGREKAMKISHPLRFTKNAGQTKKRELNALFSMISLSRSIRGTSLGQGWDTGQGCESNQASDLWIDLIL